MGTDEEVRVFLQSYFGSWGDTSRSSGKVLEMRELVRECGESQNRIDNVHIADVHILHEDSESLVGRLEGYRTYKRGLPQFTRNVEDLSGPFEIVKTDHGWKLADFTSSGRSVALSCSTLLEGKLEVDGCEIVPRAVHRSSEATWLYLEVLNRSSIPRRLSAAALREPVRTRPGPTAYRSWVAPGETLCTYGSWRRSIPLDASIIVVRLRLRAKGKLFPTGVTMEVNLA